MKNGQMKKNTPFFIKFSALAIIFFGIVSIILILYNL